MAETNSLLLKDTVSKDGEGKHKRKVGNRLIDTEVASTTPLVISYYTNSLFS